MNRTVNAVVNGASVATGGVRQVIENAWRRVPESNRSTRICNPLRNLSANPPEMGRGYTKANRRATHSGGARGALSRCNPLRNLSANPPEPR